MNAVRRKGSAVRGTLRRFTVKGDAMVWLEVGRWEIAPPEEFEAVDAVENFIEVNAETWRGTNSEEFMDEIRERD